MPSSSRRGTAAGSCTATTTVLSVGARADLVLLDAENAADVLVRAPRRELVIAGGQVVVRDGELQV